MSADSVRSTSLVEPTREGPLVAPAGEHENHPAPPHAPSDGIDTSRPRIAAPPPPMTLPAPRPTGVVRGRPSARQATETHYDHGPIRVRTGDDPRRLRDDRVYFSGTGAAELDLGRRGYSAGYLAHYRGRLQAPLGTAVPESHVLGPESRAANLGSGPAKLDAVFARIHGEPGRLAARYMRDGYDPRVPTWYGFCDRWAATALSAEVMGRVDEPLAFAGAFFSVAELRGLATYLGRPGPFVDEGDFLYIQDPTAMDVITAVNTLVVPNGAGFVGNVWVPRRNGGEYQIWNQPFFRASQTVESPTEAEQAAIAAQHFGVTDLEGRQVRTLTMNVEYGRQAGDDAAEGAPRSGHRTWRFYVLVAADGLMLDAREAPGSAEGLAHIWVPSRPSHFGSREAELFFTRVLGEGVPLAQVQAFEAEIAHVRTRLENEQRPLTDDEKQDLRARYAGIAAAYPSADLDRALVALGMSASDFARPVNRS
jgi:hypothetical protein